MSIYEQDFYAWTQKQFVLLCLASHQAFFLSLVGGRKWTATIERIYLESS